MFFGRKKELNAILETLKEPKNHIMIYGNRRVGKTTLANKAMKDAGLPFISFECRKASSEVNLHSLLDQVKKENLIPQMIQFDDFEDLFSYLDSLNKRIVFLIDEFPYQYIYEDKQEIDSLWQKILDKYSHNLNFILSGSHIGMMKSLNSESNPLYGRIKTKIHLEELDYLEASEFYPMLSPYDKAAFYAVFGGSPFILNNLNFTLSLKDNIKNTILNPLNSVNMYVTDGYTTDITAKDKANQIFQILGNSKLRYSRLEELLGLEKNGLLSKQLTMLLDMEFIEKNAPINKENDSKKVTYSIKNNLMRFYYTFLYGRSNILQLIGEEEFYQEYIEKGLLTFISLRFEAIAKCFLSRMVKSRKITGISNIGSFYYDDVTTKTNGEFDIALCRNGTYDILEVKYFKEKVNLETINKEISQIKNIKGIPVNDYGFITINGTESCPSLKYNFNGDDLYSDEIKD